MNFATQTPPAPPTGERRRVAILFADLEGFTGLSEERDPEEVADFLHALFGEFSTVIERHGGYVDKYMGDAVMALFGAPVAHEDDLMRAVRAGLALVETALGTLDLRGRPIALRVGIHHGEVVAGTHGAGGGMSYTVTGDTANTAARLQGVAPAGTVLVSDRVYRAVAPLVEAHELPMPDLKGKRERVRGWIVEGLRAGVPSRSIQGPFVGRSTEEARLASAGESVRRGSGKAVIVEGEPGLGKSRLVREFTAGLAEPGWRILEGRGEALGGAPFGPLRQVLRQALEEAAGTDTDRARQVVSAWVGDEPELEREVFALLGLAELGPPGEGRPEVRPLALGRTLRSLAADRPTAVVLEDLHWCDSDTLALLLALAARIREAPVLLLLTSRSPLDLDFIPPESRPERLVLEPLDDDACGRLSRALAERSGVDATDLARRSAGNPLFLEELVSSAAENGDQLPDSIQALIQSRLDRVPPGPRDAIRCASVLGVEFPRTVLRRLCARASGSREFERDIQFLLDRRFLTRPDGGTLAFRHALVREVAYDNELKRKRRRMHEWAGEAIEDSLASSPEFHPLLAYHYSEAESWPRALPHLQAAGRLALSQYAVREAARWLEMASEAVERGEASLSTEKACPFWYDLAECRLQRGEHVPALKAADELLAEALASGSDAFVGRAHLLRGRIHWSQNRAALARAEFEQGLAATPTEWGGERAELLNACGVAASLGDGDVETGEHLLKQALAAWHRSGDRLGQAKASVNIANLMVRRNRLDDALEWYDRTLDIGRAIPDRMVLTINLTNRGMVQFWRGEYTDAEECLREGLAVGDELGLEQHTMQISEDLGRCRLAIGDLRSACDLFQRVKDRAVAVASAQSGWACLYLGRTYFSALETDRAAEYWRDCRHFLQEHREAELEAELLLDEGRLYLVRGDPDGAASRFHGALAKAEEGDNAFVAAVARGFLWLVRAESEGSPPVNDTPGFENRPPLAALLRFQAGRALRACGRPEEALQKLVSAATLTDAMGAARLGRHIHAAAGAAAHEAGHTEAAEAHREKELTLLKSLALRLPTDVPLARFRQHLPPDLRRSI